ncbi:MAG: arginine--tRNA ligase [Deltaproteobacteria bacterium]|nr:arginine--tRNA ligase [Deltaproteobacteria bacterium]
MHRTIIDTLSALIPLDPEVIAPLLVRPKDIKQGDFALPCFVLAKTWKLSPAECAKKLVAELKPPPSISRVESVGPYLNFFIDRSTYAKDVLTKILTAKLNIGKGQDKNETIVLDYSAPNIAKPFHVGHLRTTLIGNALHRIYRHLGYTTVAINHLGDWGTQFGFVYAGCNLWGRPQNATVDELVTLYQRANKLRKAQDQNEVPAEDTGKPNVNEIARDYFRRLEAGEPQAREFWQWCLDISLDYFKTMYDRMGINFDYYQGESFYEDKLAGVQELVRKSGILEESRGALGVDLGKPLGFARMISEDGRSLYIMRDIAAAEYRFHTFKPCKILYVVGAPQTLHFQQLVAILAKMNHPAAELIVHIPFGTVLGVSTRNATEKGQLLLKDLLDDAHARALKAYHHEVSKRPQDLDDQAVAEAVGLGAILFSYLSRSNIKDFKFDWDEALNFQGDTGPYLQYALARLHSIAAKAAEQHICYESGFDTNWLTEEEYWDIISQISRFQEVLEKTAAEYEPYLLANYLLDLARAFSGLYKKARVMGEDNAAAAVARLALFDALKYVLHTGLELLGIPPLERM